jgi:predicted nucleic acid-binding protein
VAVLDTNILLRYLTEDEPEQSPRAIALLEQLEAGQRHAFLPEGVLVEAVQVLSSRRLYAVGRETIRRRIGAVVRLRGIRMPQKQTYLRALDFYVEFTRLSFVDALLAAYAGREPDNTVISFDNDFRNLPDIVWEQP